MTEQEKKLRKNLLRKTKAELVDTLEKVLKENVSLLTTNSIVAKNEMQAIARADFFEEEVYKLSTQLDSKWNPAYIGLACGFLIGGVCGYLLKGAF